MSGGMVALIVLGGLFLFALIIVMWVVGIYNSLVALRNMVKNAWAQIDVQLKRRHDLIPNLVETVKGYAKHESGTLEAVIAARNQAVKATSVDEQIKAEQNLGGGARVGAPANGSACGRTWRAAQRVPFAVTRCA